MLIKSRHMLMVSALPLIFSLLNCGGGGSSSESAETDSNSAQTTQESSPSNSAANKTFGGATLLLTDAPDDQFDHAFATIAGINLVAEDGTLAPLFAGEKQVDLLALKSFSDVFATSDEIPVGNYKQIQVEISQLKLVSVDADGNVLNEFLPNLPESGLLELIPGELFSIGENENVIIKIDFDVEKSFSPSEINGDDFDFTPALFLDIDDDESLEQEKLARLTGIIKEVDVDFEELTFCVVADGVSEQTEVCYEADVDEDAAIYGELGQLLTLADLAEGEQAVISGWLSYEEGSEQGSEQTPKRDALELDVAVIEMFDATVVEGTIARLPEEFQFDLLLDPTFSVEFGDTLTVSFDENVKIYDRQGDELDFEDLDTEELSEGIALTVSGFLNDETGTFNATLLFADIKDDDDLIVGELEDIDFNENKLTIGTELGDMCVTIDSASDILSIAQSSAEDIEISDIDINTMIRVYGELIDGECVSAASIISFPQPEAVEE